MPKVGDRVVVVQHATIPFGARGTVLSLHPELLWMNVTLDEPCVAGVSKSSSLDVEDCIGRTVDATVSRI